MIQEIFKRLNQYAVDIPTEPVNSWWNAKPFHRNAEPHGRAAKHLGHAWYIGKRFCRSSCVPCSTLSAGIESMELRNIRTDLFASFDGQLRASVSNSERGDLPDLRLCRPSWRAASYLVLSWSPWWIISARPSGLLVKRSWPSTALGRDEALSRLASTLSTATALDLLAKLDEAYAESHLSRQNVLSGSEPAMRDQPSSAPRHARGITPDDGDGDEEHTHTRKRTKIQGIITAYIDSGVREGLLQMHEGEGSWAARTRLAELGDPNVDHTWLWRLNPRHGSTLDADEYVDSVRFRLGCAGPAEPITCAACNSGILDTGAAHASCCALGEATRGHNAVSSLIHAAAQQCDHTFEMEVPGLIPGTD